MQSQTAGAPIFCRKYFFRIRLRAVFFSTLSFPMLFQTAIQSSGDLQNLLKAMILKLLSLDFQQCWYDVFFCVRENEPNFRTKTNPQMKQSLCTSIKAENQKINEKIEFQFIINNCFHGVLVFGQWLVLSRQPPIL